jgi:hypothetical protein
MKAAGRGHALSLLHHAAHAHVPQAILLNIAVSKATGQRAQRALPRTVTASRGTALRWPWQWPWQARGGLYCVQGAGSGQRVDQHGTQRVVDPLCSVLCRRIAC